MAPDIPLAAMVDAVVVSDRETNVGSETSAARFFARKTEYGIPNTHRGLTPSAAPTCVA